MIHSLLSIQVRTQTFILKHFRHTPYGRYMAKIRNSHLGESCFIIGNGPSLTVEDLNTLHNGGIDILRRDNVQPSCGVAHASRGDRQRPQKLVHHQGKPLPNDLDCKCARNTEGSICPDEECILLFMEMSPQNQNQKLDIA